MRRAIQFAVIAFTICSSPWAEVQDASVPRSSSPTAVDPEIAQAMNRIEKYTIAGDCEKFIDDGLSPGLRALIPNRERKLFCEDGWLPRKTNWLTMLTAARHATPRLSASGDLAFYNLSNAQLPENFQILQLTRDAGRWYVDTNRTVQSPDDLVFQPAWSFAGTDQRGKAVRLEDLRGSWAILFFFVTPGGPGDLAEAASFRDLYVQFHQLNARVLGISTSTVSEHARFAKELALPFSLIADADRRIVQKFGVMSDVGDTTSRRALRTTFVVSPDGIVQRVYYFVDPARHAAEVLAELPDLQANRKPAGVLSPLAKMLLQSVFLLREGKCRDYLQKYEPLLWNPGSSKDRSLYADVACRDGNRERLIETYQTATEMIPALTNGGNTATFSISGRMTNPSYETLILKRNDGSWSIDSFSSYSRQAAVFPSSNQMASKQRTASRSTKSAAADRVSKEKSSGVLAMFFRSAVETYAASKGVVIPPEPSPESGASSTERETPTPINGSTAHSAGSVPLATARTHFPGPGCATNISYLRPQLHEQIWNEPAGQQTLNQSIDSFIKSPNDIDRQIVAMRIQRDNDLATYEQAKSCADAIAPDGVPGNYPRVVGEPKGAREACLSVMHLHEETIMATDAMIEAYECRRGRQ